MRKQVAKFAHAMETTLQTHDGDKGEAGWLGSDCSVEFLLDRLKDEIKEAEAAFADCASEDLAKECVDIANFSMMIYDRIKENSDDNSE